MAKSALKPTDRKSLIALVRAELAKTRGQRLSLRQFLASTGLGRYDVSKFFDSWSEVMRAAGAPFDVNGRRVPRERLLADWGAVAWKLRRLPSAKAYKVHGNYGFSTLSRCFGGWAAVKNAFREYAAGKDEWAEVLALVEGRKAVTAGAPAAPKKPSPRIRRRRQDHFAFGEPLLITGLRNAPTNESGVIYLFGVIGERLGFQVEAIRTAFPDCVAKRRMSSGEWRNVTIEFEYESRNFVIHGHDPAGCELLVCWTHNWPDCPENIEVIALSDAIKKI
ncbi:MAG TPA: hypothetical protein VG733_04480 [Chthoniobacteraceae bacterium]|nr:hypothetical protein [Chthoniobacteraceae bacterium]